MNPEDIHYLSEDKWIALPSWGRFFINIGSAVSSSYDKEARLVIGIALPTRSHAACLVATGVIVTRALIPIKKGGAKEHFEWLKTIDPGTPVMLLEADRKLKGIFVGYRSEIRDGEFKEYIGVQVTNKQAGGLTNWIPPEKSLKVELSSESVNDLPNNQKGRAVGQKGFLDYIIGETGKNEFALRSRLECVILGQVHALQREIIETPISAKTTSSKHISGTFQDLLRVRKFYGDGKPYRTDLYAVNKNQVPPFTIDETEITVIFDGATGFLKWRDYLRHFNWVVLLDRTEPGFIEAARAFDQEFIQNRLDEYSLNQNMPRGVEIIAYKEAR